MKMGKISEPTQAAHSFKKPLSFAFSPAKAVYLLALAWQTPHMPAPILPIHNSTSQDYLHCLKS